MALARPGSEVGSNTPHSARERGEEVTEDGTLRHHHHHQHTEPNEFIRVTKCRPPPYKRYWEMERSLETEAASITNASRLDGAMDFMERESERRVGLGQIKSVGLKIGHSKSDLVDTHNAWGKEMEMPDYLTEPVDVRQLTWSVKQVQKDLEDMREKQKIRKTNLALVEKEWAQQRFDAQQKRARRMGAQGRIDQLHSSSVDALSKLKQTLAAANAMQNNRRRLSVLGRSHSVMAMMGLVPLEEVDESQREDSDGQSNDGTDSDAVEVEFSVIREMVMFFTNARLRKACWEGDLPLLMFLHTHWPSYVDGTPEMDPNVYGIGRESALHLAAREGHADIVFYLINSMGAKPNFRTTSGKTALHYACSRGQVECCEVLLDLGADGNARDWHGHSPLHVTLSSDLGDTTQIHIAKMLFDMDVTTSLFDHEIVGQQLRLAVEKGHIQYVKLLLMTHLQPPDCICCPAMESAVTRGFRKLVEKLLIKATFRAAVDTVSA